MQIAPTRLTHGFTRSLARISDRRILDSALAKKRVIGISLLVMILALFLAFNRIPKLDTIEQDLAGVNAPQTSASRVSALKGNRMLGSWNGGGHFR